MNSKYRPYIIRLLVVIAISLIIVLVINETFFYFQKTDHDRAPKTIQLVIPQGTADQIASGESVATIPEKMVFVRGDVLEVKNEDEYPHQLGPIWVPPGSTGSIVLEQVNKFSYSCSFAPSRYLGLDVREPTTIETRFIALAFATPPLVAFLFIYGLLVYPVNPENKKKEMAEVRP